MHFGWLFVGEKSGSEHVNFDERRFWNSVEATFHWLKHHLKNVMLYACVTEPYVIELIEFLLGNVLILEKMVISTKKNTGVARNGESHYRPRGGLYLGDACGIFEEGSVL